MQGWACLWHCSAAAGSAVVPALPPMVCATASTLDMHCCMQIRPLEELYKFGHFFR